VTDSLAHIGPAMTAAFLASLVEAVEALTIVLAVATVRGWPPAGLGALAAQARIITSALLTARSTKPMGQRAYNLPG
jgi:uncharacterized membrane protein